MWAVLPVKNFAAAKQRLSGVLNPAERQQLCRTMLEDVLAALVAAPGLAGVAVISPDDEAATVAGRHGARIIHEAEARGLTAAADTAMSQLAAEGARGVLVVPGDVPRVTPADIGCVLEGHGRAPAVSIVPARDEGGSNALACSPPGVITLAYGPGSFQRHCDLARARDIEPRVVRVERLALDIDTPDDLRALLASDGNTRTDAFLRNSGIADRLLADVSAAAWPRCGTRG